MRDAFKHGLLKRASHNFRYINVVIASHSQNLFVYPDRRRLQLARLFYFNHFAFSSFAL